MQEKDHIRERLKGTIVALGVGNPLKGDDGFGPELTNRLKDKVNFQIFDCGTAPENYIGKIEKLNPDTVIIFDISKSGNPPGTIKIFELDDISDSGLSTHDPSLRLFMDVLKKSKNIDIFLLSIEPKQTEFGSKLSKEISLSINELETFFIKNFPKE